MEGIDYSGSVQRIYEFYKVDPISWLDTGSPIKIIRDCSITRDSTTNTKENATFNIDNVVGEFYIRVYMVSIQNHIKYKEPLGTFLLQTPAISFDGKVKNMTANAYSSLLELDEKIPGPGFTINGDNPLESIKNIVSENARAPLVATVTGSLSNGSFVSNDSDTWLSYLTELLDAIDYEFALDGYGKILLPPIININDMQPKWTYIDDENSILLPDITMNKDIYKIPNVLQVISSNSEDGKIVEVINDDINSQLSIQQRGRKIVKRIEAPEIYVGSSDEILYDYAKKQLKQMSTVDCTINYTHGYNNTRVGDCIRIKYRKAGFDDIKAKIQSQTIQCTPACTVNEVAICSINLWE